MLGVNAPHSRRLTLLLLLGGIALAILPARPAMAGKAREPALLVVQAKGAVRDKAIAADAVTAAVTQAGWALAPRTFAPQETEEVAKCLVVDRPWACVTRAVRDDALRRLALLSLEAQAAPDGGAMTVVTIMVASAEQQDIAYSGRRYCQACSPDSLAKLTTAATREVLDKMYLASGRTFLQVKSRPAGALVEVDGKQIGVTDGAFEILPGRHQVVVKHPKHPPETRWVDAEEDKTAIVTVAFGPTTEPPRTPAHSDRTSTDPKRSLLLPKLVVATGGLVLASGVLALLLDEDAGSPPPLDDSPSQRHLNTAPLGAGLLVAGALIAGAGGWWWWSSRGASSATSAKTSSPKRNVSAAFVVQPTGAAFSFSSSF